MSRKAPTFWASAWKYRFSHWCSYSVIHLSVYYTSYGTGTRPIRPAASRSWNGKQNGSFCNANCATSPHLPTWWMPGDCRQFQCLHRRTSKHKFSWRECTSKSNKLRSDICAFTLLTVSEQMKFILWKRNKKECEITGSPPKAASFWELSALDFLLLKSFESKLLPNTEN